MSSRTLFTSRQRRLRFPLRTLIIIAAVFLLLGGGFVAGYKLQAKLTAEAAATAYAKYAIGLPSHKQELIDGQIPEVMKTDYAQLIELSSAADVETKRQAAFAYIFRGQPSAMTRQPDEVERDVTFLPLADLDNLAGIDRLVVRMEYGVESTVYHLKPTKAQSCVMLYQEGHRVSMLARKPFLGRMLAQGCDVYGLSLPLTGPLNNRPEIDHPRFGHMLLNDPDDLQLVDSSRSSFLHFFILPMVATLNHALAEKDYDRVGVTGFSGGGWAVEIMAALDPRITASYAVAGSAPEALHAALPSWGSPEQRDARFYEIANYVELYTMGAAGTGRRQYQFFNETDPCCFSGHNWRAYRDGVAAKAKALGGTFRLFAYMNEEHRISPPVAQTIAEDFMGLSAPLPPGIQEPR